MKSQTKRVAYVNCELGGIVVACNIDDHAGLCPTQSVKVYPADFAGDDHPDNFGKASFWTAEASLSADARFLYPLLLSRFVTYQSDLD